jgi:hypothetical protein
MGAARAEMSPVRASVGAAERAGDVVSAGGVADDAAVADETGMAEAPGVRASFVAEGLAVDGGAVHAAVNRTARMSARM